MEKVKRYRCVKEFEVENYDEDCFPIYDEYTVIKPGSIWQDGGFSFNIGEVHLENDDDLQWIEIPVAYLTEYFKQIENN
jgi:hypothetical protein